MAKPIKKKETVSVFKILLRLVIFVIIAVFSISYFQNQIALRDQSSQHVLGTSTQGNFQFVDKLIAQVYDSLPQDSKDKLELAKQVGNSTGLQESLNQYGQQISSYPQKKLKEISVAILQNIFNYLKDTIEGKK